MKTPLVILLSAFVVAICSFAISKAEKTTCLVFQTVDGEDLAHYEQAGKHSSRIEPNRAKIWEEHPRRVVYTAPTQAVSDRWELSFAMEEWE